MTHNWNEEWKQLQKSRRAIADAAFWDRRAATFSSNDAPDAYVRSFLKLARINPGEHVLDMGCGTGALCIPLAKTGCEVVAADFSSGMLDVMRRTLAQRDVKGVKPLLMSWEDRWAEHGVGNGSVDVALASRSLSVHDLEAALDQLTQVARRRVCITVSTGAPPRSDERVLRAARIDPAQQSCRDHLYVLNILKSKGMHTETNLISSTRCDTFDSLEEAYARYDAMVREAATGLDAAQVDHACARMHPWLRDQLTKNDQAGEPDDRGRPQKRLRLAEPRTVTWAFIAWDTSCAHDAAAVHEADDACETNETREANDARETCNARGRCA